VSAGATLRERLTTFVSGDRYASLIDPFGVRWSIMTRVEDLSSDETRRRVADWAEQQGEKSSACELGAALQSHPRGSQCIRNVWPRSAPGIPGTDRAVLAPAVLGRDDPRRALADPTAAGGDDRRAGRSRGKASGR
jgi:hypothetical protein